MHAIAHQTLRKVAWRLIPFLGVLYFFAFLDRVNLGFAALTMNADLGLSAAVFGVGAGIFFIGYIVFEVPSNIMLERFGARIWIARIMVSWGLCSAAMALVQGPISFYVVRFLLGVAEAGFFPGVIYYLTCWFPHRHRGQIIALFMIALPLSSILGAPISTALLGIEMQGLRGWQWMFLLEALPTIVLGFVVLLVLPDRPSQAPWLDAEQKRWLESELARERDSIDQRPASSLREALTRPRAWRHGAVYLCILVGLYGFAFWLPQIIASLAARSNVQVGFLTMVPYTLACVALVGWGRHSDATGERAWHVAIPCLLAAGALVVCGYAHDPNIAFAALCAAAVGIYSGLPCFWAMVSRGLQGSAAAAVIALVNSLGSFGGFLGPAAIGFAHESTGSYATSFLFIAACLVFGAVFALFGRGSEKSLAASGVQKSV
ncbi:MAG: MFS transporter [Pseudomonadota bacterium]|nr:MFS transporter [Pseudomonadota bacterium]